MKNHGSRAENFLIFLCFCAYAASYVGRMSYNANISQIEAGLGVSHSQSGLVTTFFFLAYGTGQLANAFFCKRYNRRFVIAGALAVSGGANLAIFAGVPFSAYKYLWLANGAALSVLYSSIITAFGKHLGERAQKRGVLAMSFSTSAGILVAYAFSSLFALWGLYRWMFFTAAAVLFAACLLWFFSYAPAVGRLGANGEGSELPVRGKKSWNWGFALYLSLFALYAVFNNVVKDGLTMWTPSVLIERYSLSGSVSIILTLTLPMVAVLGTELAYRLNDLFKRRHLLTAGALFFVGAVSALGVYFIFGVGHWAFLVVLFAVVYCCMAGVNSLLGSIMPLDLRARATPGFISGLFDAFCYVGSAVSSFCLGSVADAYGWSSVFLIYLSVLAVPVACAVVSLFFLRRKKPPQQDDKR